MINLQHNAILSRFTSAKIEKSRGNNKKKTQKFCRFRRKASTHSKDAGVDYEEMRELVNDCLNKMMATHWLSVMVLTGKP